MDSCEKRFLVQDREQNILAADEANDAIKSLHLMLVENMGPRKCNESLPFCELVYTFYH